MLNHTIKLIKHLCWYSPLLSRLLYLFCKKTLLRGTMFFFVSLHPSEITFELSLGNEILIVCKPPFEHLKANSKVAWTYKSFLSAICFFFILFCELFTIFSYPCFIFKFSLNFTANQNNERKGFFKDPFQVHKYLSYVVQFTLKHSANFLSASQEPLHISTAQKHLTSKRVH